MRKSKLTFEFIANACGVFTGSDGTKILCDPWLVDGVFEGSWFHFHQLKTTQDDLSTVDAIYLSHLHPDHFDDRNFDFDRSIKIIALDHEPNFLIKKLSNLGFKNILKIKNQETISFREFKLTMFAPFAKHNFHSASVGNLIDSALLVSCKGVSALNANDNTLSIEAAELLSQQFGSINLAMLNYNAAGPYPSCFDNLTQSEKTAESARIIERNLNHIKNIIEVLKPKYFLPFAGAYVLGGELFYKNEYLGVTTWDKCKDWMIRNLDNQTQVVVLRENDTLDIETGVSDKEYLPIDLDEVNRYVTAELSCKKYPYQLDPIPEKQQLVRDVEESSLKLKNRMTRFNLSSKFFVTVQIFDDLYEILPNFRPISTMTNFSFLLECRMDERLLRRILDRKSTWNNAEIGGHISFVRSPNIYEPDLHTALQFFHL